LKYDPIIHLQLFPPSLSRALSLSPLHPLPPHPPATLCYTSISRLSLDLSLSCALSLSHGSETPLLLFFEWGPSFISASRVSPSESLTYGVTKMPFLWMSLLEDGDVVTFLDPDAKPGWNAGFRANWLLWRLV